MTQLGELELELAATKAAGNWRDFDSFCWHRASELEDADDWCIVYTHHRDSEILAQSNTAIIDKSLERFVDADDSDVVAEQHSHWACGWIDGYSIRVFRKGEITDAFKVYHDLAERMDQYPILDEEDFRRREFEATLENIGESAWRLKSDFDLPDEWEGDVYDWLSQNRDHSVECVGDDGAWPEEQDLEAAFINLGYERAA